MNDMIADENSEGEGWLEEAVIDENPEADNQPDENEDSIFDDPEWNEEENTVESGHSPEHASAVDINPSEYAPEENSVTNNIKPEVDIPIEVDVQLGTLVINAAESTSLTPGDLLKLETICPEQVSLMCKGREVGRGELVDIDGHLGVQIIKNWCQQ